MKSLLFVLTAIITLTAYGQNRKSPHDTVENADVKVTYGRPYKKGRVIFGELEPYGKVWRCGADEATEITFKKSMKFGGQDVKAGTYTLFVIPNQEEWTIILNSQLKQWGAFQYEKIKDKDVLKVNVPVRKPDNPVEQLTIRFVPGEMVIEWDNTQAGISLGN